MGAAAALTPQRATPYTPFTFFPARVQAVPRFDAKKIVADIAVCIGFYTRIAMPQPAISDAQSFAATQWAAPVAGALIGLCVGVIAWLALLVGLPATLAAAFALAAGALLTGALHEDGLADTADGLGGGKDRAHKLAIMRDSHLGSYGALALGLSLLARWAALAALAQSSPLALLIAAISAHAASRAILPILLNRLPPARTDGLAANIGNMNPVTAQIAGAVGILFLLPGGFGFAVTSVLLIAALSYLVARLALSQIGGQTGDILGATQQLCEIAIFSAAATILA